MLETLVLQNGLTPIRLLELFAGLGMFGGGCIAAGLQIGKRSKKVAVSSLDIPPVAYAASFQPAEAGGSEKSAPLRPRETSSRFPGGHRQFLPMKSSEDLQREFKQKEEEAPVRRASKWGQSTPDRRDAILYAGSLAVAIFTLLLISGRLPFL
jgi:hypothetical protein